MAALDIFTLTCPTVRQIGTLDSWTNGCTGQLDQWLHMTVGPMATHDSGKNGCTGQWDQWLHMTVGQWVHWTVWPMATLDSGTNGYTWQLDQWLNWTVWPIGTQDSLTNKWLHRTYSPQHIHIHTKRHHKHMVLVGHETSDFDMNSKLHVDNYDTYIMH
jgi:hypothetical protein